jgi:uncharacterized protein (DUF608 family)
MKNNPGRRSFIKKITAGGIGATMIAPVNESAAAETKANLFKIKARGFNSTYTGDYLNRIAFPVGGLGSGMFCVEGGGAISHMSVRNKPEVFNEPGMFGAIVVKGATNKARIVEGPVPGWKKFGAPNTGNGAGGSIFGLPRFELCDFATKFPFSTISLKEDGFPVEVKMTAWSPFIPGDADNSGLPAGAIEYEFHNTSSQSVDAVFSFHSKNFMKMSAGADSSKSQPLDSIRKIDNGFILSNAGTAAKPELEGHFAVFAKDQKVVVDHCWFRGGWFDPLTMTWDHIRKGELVAVEPVDSGAPGASLYVPLNLAAGEKKVVTILTAWYVPQSDLRFGGEQKAAENCDPGSGCCSTSESLGQKIAGATYTSGKYKPWYSSKFENIEAVASHFKTTYDELRKKSNSFSEAFYSSTLPAEVMEAIAANLTILKSPTVMRQFDGRLWCFEGCGDSWGCCHGSCTHVWNYAQAVCHLFPSLERTLRQTEFCESQDESGHQTFRAALPIRPVDHEFYAAADGQLGGIMKIYRDWRISGDSAWIARMYPLVKRSMDYCIDTWDPARKGVIEEPHHNTYDIEFWGPDGMCTSFYLGALQAMIAIGKFLKKKNDVASYEKLLKNGKAFMESELFNGEFFIQKIQYTGLKAPNPIDASQKSMGGHYSDEARKLLEKEGPKYQYGGGCLSDGVLGSWIARVCGLDDVVDGEKVKSHLVSVHRYNLKKDLREHANPQRPSYAMGSEGGLLLCSWPKGDKLSLPFVYSDEVWTGIEYQVASHLIMSGRVEEGLEIVRTCRARYDGKTRNPFNEYECGHWYARALSSYSLIQALTGLRFDAVEKTLYLDPKLNEFTAFLSTETGFGTVQYARDNKPVLSVFSGVIAVEQYNVSGKVIRA